MPSKANMIAGQYETFADEKLTVNGLTKFTVAKFTESDTVVAKRAIVTIENARLRYRQSGSNPTASLGHLMNPGDSVIIIGNENMKNFRMIKADTTNSQIFVSYEK